MGLGEFQVGDTEGTHASVPDDYSRGGVLRVIVSSNVKSPQVPSDGPDGWHIQKMKSDRFIDIIIQRRRPTEMSRARMEFQM